MNYAFYRTISQRRFVEYNNATGGGQDDSTDVNITRNPNDYLAPIFGNNIFTSLASVAAILIIIILILVSVRMLKNEL